MANPTALPVTREDCLRLDAADPLGPMRDAFELPPEVIYLDGNSLGALPRGVRERVADVVTLEWGRDLIRSWNSADWIHLPGRVGDKIGRLVGAAPGQVVAADSTSVNLFKVLSTALALRPDRRVIVSERGNFPTDLYIAQGLAAQLGGRHELRLVDRADGDAALFAALGGDVAAVMLTQVDYQTGSMLDMRTVSDRIHACGALAIWDLAHSAGAVPVALDADGADFAVGCGYKYLNGGPGAPAFLYVAQRHQAAARQPLSGWMGHASPFTFETGYRPAEGIDRFLCGTPAVLAMSALECGVDTFQSAQAGGGMEAIRAKSLALTDLFIARVEQRCAGQGLRLVTPREHARRGSQASFALDDGGQAYAVVQALIGRGVIGDFRAPQVLRFGFTPLYLRHVDAWDAAEHLAQVLETREWDQPRYLRKLAVT